MAKILEFNASTSVASTGSLTNEIGTDWGVVRNSEATYFDGSGVVKVGVNVPRIESGKVLIEQSAINLIPYSEDLADGSWTKTAITIGDNAGTSPDGTVNADSVIEDTSTGTHIVRKSIDYEADIYVVSAYAKQISTQRGVTLHINTGNISVSWKLTDQSILYEQGSSSNGIEDIGDGWYRAWFTTFNALTAQAWDTRFYINDEIAINGVYAGDGTSNIQLWGLNVVKGTELSSYIPSTTTSETREADVITNTVPVGTAPITMTTWIDGVSDGGQVVNQGDPITMLNGTTTVIIEDSSAAATTTVEIEWIDSVSPAATGNKIYRDTVPSTGEVEIADVPNGTQFYSDGTVAEGTEYKFEVQAHDGAGDETTQEVEGENMDYITTAGGTSNPYVFDGSANSYMTTDLPLTGMATLSTVTRVLIGTTGDINGILGYSTGTNYWLLKWDNANGIEGRAQDATNTPNIPQDTSPVYDVFATYIHTVGATESKLYTNGVLSDTDNLYPFTTMVAGNLGIGAYGGSTSPLSGQISDIQVYNKVLSQAEVTALQTSLDNTASGLIANFKHQKAPGAWTDDENGYIATNAGGVTLP